MVGAIHELQKIEKNSKQHHIDMNLHSNRITETNSNFLLDVINNSNVGYFFINSNNEITFCNNTFAQWLGTNRNSVINSDFYAHIVKNESNDLKNKSN